MRSDELSSLAVDDDRVITGGCGVVTGDSAGLSMTLSLDVFIACRSSSPESLRITSTRTL